MKRFILLLIISLIGLNCATSTKEKLVWNTNNKIDNVFFVLYNFENNRKPIEFFNSIKSNFDSRNIKNAGFYYDEKILNVENKLSEKINDMKPKFILSVTLKAIYNGGRKSYAIEIFDTELQKIVWEERFLDSGIEGPKSFSKRLMKELEKNKIINYVKE